MIRRLLAVLGLLALAACQPAARPLNPTEHAALSDSIGRHMERFFSALESRDVDSIMAFYPSGEYISAGDGMLFANRAAIDSAMSGFWGGLREASYTDDRNKITVLDRDNAVYASEWHGTATDTTGAVTEFRGVWVGTLHRDAGGWKIVAENNSSPVPPPVPVPAAARR